MHIDQEANKLRLVGSSQSMRTKVILPKNIENFRLPIDWTEEEMDIFFENMYKHVNCNGCSYKENLRYWLNNNQKAFTKEEREELIRITVKAGE